MPKKPSAPVTKQKASTNVTIIKFKTAENSKRKQTTSIEEDPLAITDYDLEAASSSNLHIKPVKFTSAGARKQLPAIKKTSSASSSFTKTTILTPTGVKKIQAIPIDVVSVKKTPVKVTKKVKNSTLKKKQTPQPKKSTTVTPLKRSARAARTSFYVDSSDSDSDEPLRKIVKKSPPAKKSTIKNKNKTPVKTTNKREVQTYNPKKSYLTKAKKQVKATTTTKKTKSSNTKKMIQKRTQRRVEYGYLSKKGVQNGNTGKTYMTKKRKLLLQAKKQRKTLDDYLPLIRKYRHLIPEDQPYVRIERLKFNAAHFTKERTRLTSDIDLFRDGAAFYGLLSNIFNHLDLTRKLLASRVCRLWNRSLNEDGAWNSLPLKNIIIHDLKPLERIILKRETKIILLNNVDVIGKAADYELCRLSCVKDLIIQENASPLLLNKLLIACNELENVVTPDSNLDDLHNLNIYVKSLHAENSVVSEYENRLLKTWSDLEKLVVHTFDPNYYYNMGLLLSLRYLKLQQLSITSNIAQFIENIPNIECIEFMPEYSNINYAEGNKAIVESLKHCPSLKKLTWITIKEIDVKKEIKVEVKPEPIKDEPQNEEKLENDEIHVPKESETPTSPEETLPTDILTADTQGEPEKMEVDEVPQSENTEKSDLPMETDETPQEMVQAENNPNQPEIMSQEDNITQDQNNVDLFDNLKTTEETNTCEDGDKVTNNENVTDVKEEKVKEEDEIKDDVESVKSESLSEISECKQKSMLEMYQSESLKWLALQTYLKSSLPECEVNFKVIKKYNYIE